jgi:hypothetical protein
MKRILLLAQALALAGALFSASSPVQARSAKAQAPQGPLPPITEFRGSVTEFRGYGFIAWGLQDDIWRLKSDGSATMVYVLRRGISDRGSSGVEGGDAGTWSMRDGQICVEWRVRRDISGCYTIQRKGGIHVRLVGPVTYEGTLE